MAARISKPPSASLSDNERQLLERAERNGVPLDWAALDRVFNFTASPIITPGVDPAVLGLLARAVTELAENQEFSCELSGIVVFPIITNPEIYSRPDFVTHKRASRGYFVGRNIELDRWRRARTPGRIAMALENYKLSVAEIPVKHLCPENKLRLLAMLDAASLTIGHVAAQQSVQAAGHRQPWPAA